jgi:hypothetical protein
MTKTIERSGIAPAGIWRALIQTRADGQPDEADLALINRLARSPLKAEDLFAFDCVPSTDAIDSYWTRQAPSSMANYARDAMLGVALMNSHRTSPWMGEIELPIGRSYYGEVQAPAEGTLDALTRLFVKAYMLRNYQPNQKTANTDELIRGIEAGVIFDLSIGFKPGWYRCSICGLDLFDRDCPHFPGAKYGESGSKVRAYAWVEDAHLGEFSTVYDGATPGAGIVKAQRAVEAGTLDRKAITDLEDCYQVRLVKRWAVDRAISDGPMGAADYPSVPDLAPQRGGDPIVKPKGTEFIDLLIANLQQRVGRELSAANIETLRGVKDSLAGASDTLEEAATKIADLLARVGGEDEDEDEEEAESERVAELRGQVTTLEGRVAELTGLADLGRQYRADLIEATLKEGVRLFGAEFRAETHRAMLERSTLNEIKAVRTDWERAAKAKLGPGGRQTTPEPLGADSPAPKRNPKQYQ